MGRDSASLLLFDRGLVMLRLPILVLVLLLVAGACAPEATAPPDTPAAEDPAEGDRVTLRLDWLAAPPHIPFVYGVAEGIYAQHGLDLIVLEGRGSLLAAQVVAAGADDFGFADFGAYALARAEGAPIQMVASVLQDNTAELAFFCDQGIETPADLEGKSIADFAGSALLPLIPALLEANRVSPDAVEMLIVDPIARTATVIERTADAGTGFGIEATIRYEIAAREAGAGEICTLAFSDWGVLLLGHGVIVNEQTLETNPDLVRRFLAASAEAFEAAVANPEAAIEAMQAFSADVFVQEIMERGFEATIQALHTPSSAGCPWGWAHPENVEDSVELLVEYRDLQLGLLRPGDFFTDEFLPEQC